MTTKLILTAIGQLPQDTAVLERALEVAHRSDAELRVVHVLDLPGNGADLADVTTFLGQAVLAARDRIELALTELDADSSNIAIQIELGPHALTLIDICQNLKPDLIVMRAHQNTKIKERLLGSTTDRVIAAAETPVLVVKRAVKESYDCVVVATNGADNALEASEFVIDLLPEVRLNLVQAVQIPPQLKEAMLRVGSRKSELESHRTKLLNDAKNHLRNLAEKVGRRVKSQVLKGDPANALTRLCRKRDVGLIVLGQGRSSLVRRAFIGSVSRRLLRDAPCDVLIWCPKGNATA